MGFLLECQSVCFSALSLFWIYFNVRCLSICPHFVSMSVYHSVSLFVYFSPLNGRLVDLNLATAVPKFRRCKVELTVLYHLISRLLHHALTPPRPSTIPPSAVAIKNQLRWVNIKWQERRRERRESWKIEESFQDKKEYRRVNFEKGTKENDSLLRGRTKIYSPSCAHARTPARTHARVHTHTHQP
jgi:hypothetical protein